ncbi:MAG: SIS domain-containing protein [Candidatus Berkelbacteria bacterium]|nr:SIS domain-containing protein [Candidatus Berkelbacteria bacterium]
MEDDYGWNGFVKRTTPVAGVKAWRGPDNLPEYKDPKLCLKAATPEMILNEISYIRTYAAKICHVVQSTQATTDVKHPLLGLPQTMHLSLALDDMLNAFRTAHETGHKVILVGNGGSSAICSHVAIDLSKNAGIRAISFNDFPTLTCLSNDFGYDQVFAKQIEYHARVDDVLVCISTGGKSPNILNAAQTFKDMGGRQVFTFTGMKADNSLRTMGRVNFYSPSTDFGIVEISHLTLLHSLCPCEG